MGWLEDVLAALQGPADGAYRDPMRPGPRGGMQPYADPLRTDRVDSFPLTMLDADPMTAGGVMPGGPGLPYPTGGDPMTAGGIPGGPVPDMAAEQLRSRILASNPAFGFPTSQPMEKYTDFASGWPIDMERPKAQFGDIPPGPPPAPPGMAPGTPLAGLNSPVGGGGDPFSIAGAPPSLVAAKAMAAPPPPPMTEQPPVPAMVAGVPGMPGAPPVMAQGEAPPAGGPTDASAARRGPPGAPPAAAPMGMVPPGAPVGVPPELTMSDRLNRFGDALNKHGPMLMALGAGLAGAPSLSEGISRGLAAATPYGAARQKRDEDLALQTSQSNATARLLLSKGASLPEVQAAVAGGADTMKALLGQYLTKDKFTVTQTGEDKYGRKTFQVFNAADGTLKELPAGSAAEAKTMAQSEALEGVTGQARLDALMASDPDYARKVKAAVNGDISLPTGRPANTPLGKKFIEDVLAVDGNVSEADFKIRQQVRKNYTSGKDFQVTKSINTVVDHGIQLEKAIKALNNNNYFTAITNPVRDAFLSQTDPKYITAKKEFSVNAENFAREMDFALSGGRPTVSGAQHQREAFDALSAQVGQQAALKKSIELLDARLKEHQRGYEESVPPGTRDAIVPRLEKKTTEFIDKILGNNAPGGGSGVLDIGGKKIPWSVK